MDELVKALYGVGIAALAVLTSALGVLLYYTPQIVRAWLEGRRLISLQSAGELSAQATEERSIGKGWSSEAKRSEAVALVKSIAPHAAKKAGPTLVADVVQAGVAKLRASTPTPEQLDAAIRILSPLPPPRPSHIPAPPRVPSDVECP